MIDSSCGCNKNDAGYKRKRKSIGRKKSKRKSRSLRKRTLKTLRRSRRLK